jgi:hypothetical protein
MHMTHITVIATINVRRIRRDDIDACEVLGTHTSITKQWNGGHQDVGECCVEELMLTYYCRSGV